jgi:hypothetical protein
MHSTNSDLNNTNVPCRKSVVDTRSCHIDRLLVSIILDPSESKFTSSSFTKDVDVEFLCWTAVDAWESFLYGGGLWDSGLLRWGNCLGQRSFLRFSGLLGS